MLMVRFIGPATYSIYGSDDPSNLVPGHTYEVLDQVDYGWQTNYVLHGVPGQYNSVWFAEVVLPTYVAVAKEFPQMYQRLNCTVVEKEFGQLKLAEICTSVVREIESLGSNLFKVTTCNSIYCVNVIT